MSTISPLDHTFKIPREIILPKNLSRFKVSEGWLYVAPDIGSAILVDDIGDSIFQSLRKESNPLVVLSGVIKTLDAPEKVIFQSFVKLLGYIKLEQFFDSTMPNLPSFEVIEKGLHLYLTHSCNYKCVHCYLDAGKKMQSELNIEQFKEAINFFAPHILNINFSGGEPMLADFFFDLASWVKKNHNVDMTLYTNGSKIDSSQTAAFIAEHFSEVQVSLDGAQKDVAESIRGLGSYERTLNAVRLLTRQQISELALAICIIPSNIDDLCENLLPLLDSIDPDNRIKSIRFASVELFGRARDEFVYDQSEENVKKLNTLQKQIIQSGRRVWERYQEVMYHEYFDFNKGNTKRIANTCSFGQTLVLDSNGDIYPCAFSIEKSKIGNFFDKNFKKELLLKWLKTFNQHTVDQMEPCNKCEIKYLCLAGCRLNHYRLNGQFDKPVCDEHYKGLQLEKIAMNFKKRFSDSSKQIIGKRPIL